MRATTLMDMSTIVPIVLALLIFFGSVVSAINTVNEKNKRIDLTFSLVNVVDTLTQSGVITQQNLAESVDLLRGTLPANFYVCITDVNDDEYRNCQVKASKESGVNEGRDPEEVISRLHGDYISFAFPVTYQTNLNDIPFNEVNKMLVIVWQGA